jgi:hypothetical protein
MKKVVLIVDNSDAKARELEKKLTSYHLRPRRVSPSEALQMVKEGVAEHICLRGSLSPASWVLRDLERMSATSS